MRHFAWLLIISGNYNSLMIPTWLTSRDKYSVWTYHSQDHIFIKITNHAIWFFKNSQQQRWSSGKINSLKFVIQWQQLAKLFTVQCGENYFQNSISTNYGGDKNWFYLHLEHHFQIGRNMLRWWNRWPGIWCYR